jgi:hypothetical protein
MSKKVHLLDYVAGNIRSLVNAIEKCGYEVEWIKSPEDVKNAEVRETFLCTQHKQTNYHNIALSLPLSSLLFSHFTVFQPFPLKE